jgi:lysophospholipase L1-like esterase
MNSICVFGDSTAWGVSDQEKGGWVNRLWFYAGKKTKGKTKIYNLGIEGGTVNTILARFELEAKIRKADAFIFQSGGNDSVLIGKNGRSNVSADQFEKNLEEIIKKAKIITPDIIFIGFNNVDDKRTAPAPWGNFYYHNSKVEKYNEIMKNICQKNNIPYIDIFNLLKNEDLADGLHPNSLGHEKIFQKVKNFLEENKWI